MRQIALNPGTVNKYNTIDRNMGSGPEAGEWVGTNFERKYLKEQRGIYTIAAKKN